jgi:hypothetical protein
MGVQSACSCSGVAFFCFSCSCSRIYCNSHVVCVSKYYTNDYCNFTDSFHCQSKLNLKNFGFASMLLGSVRVSKVALLPGSIDIWCSESLSQTNYIHILIIPFYSNVHAAYCVRRGVNDFTFNVIPFSNILVCLYK